MTTGHVFIATSTDGCIARTDGGLDWLDIAGIEAEEHGFDAFLASVDGVVMGRGTYEKVLEFDGDWPYSKPVIDLSRTLTDRDIPTRLQNTVQVSNLAPRAVMENLSDQGWTRAYIDGGKVIQSFLRENLIQDMILTRIPVLLGGGVPLFGPLDGDIALVHQTTRSFASGLVTSTYKIDR